MTLFDFGKLLRHYLKLIIVLPIACAVVSGCFLALMPKTYQAISTAVISADLTVINGFAQNESVKYSQNGIAVSSEANVANQTIVITAEGNDYGGCIAAANAAILALGDDVRNVDPNSMVDIREATSANNISQSIPRSVFLAFFLGLVLAIFIVIIIDAVKMPIKSRFNIENNTDISVIGEIPSRDRGECLLANIRFIAGCTPSVIAVVPVSGVGAAATCAELTNALIKAGEKTNRVKANAHVQGLKSELQAGIITVVECLPLAEGMGAAYIARDADLTIICVAEWLDSCKALSNVIRELNLAKAKLGGAVLLIDGKPTKTF